MANETAKRFMDALQQIEQSRQVEPLVELFAEDATLSNLAHQEQGRDGAHKFWSEYLAVFERIHSEFSHVTANDQGAAMEWTSEGALKTGEPIRYQGISVIETEGDKVKRFRTYYDSAAFLTQGAKE